MSLTRAYKHDGEGFAPLYIAENWQVAQINYSPALAPANIHSIDIHFETDELFILLEGEAVLVAARGTEGDSFIFETTLLEKNVIYNIPRKTWHNIALNPGAKVLIFEDKNSHLSKFEIKTLSGTQAKKLQAQIMATFGKNPA
jgi:mannose-6-phosphate isomerase-like protein (cupin superfamily)